MPDEETVNKVEKKSSVEVTSASKITTNWKFLVTIVYITFQATVLYFTFKNNIDNKVDSKSYEDRYRRDSLNEVDEKRRDSLQRHDDKTADSLRRLDLKRETKEHRDSTEYRLNKLEKGK